ncbi:hypothetical protein PIB30_002400 [Stylosanthes scabra]|uniref:Uncharacterized protein n=1 Tax=Stylosanthes scabra TaxID=79078 RepID=A0ABU6V1W6_9FABA|nr:hypothetical protein [Stylosanthes scabra]
MEERPIEEIVAVDRREMHRLNEVSHVAHNVHVEKDRCIVSVRRQIGMGLDPRAEPEVATGDSFVPRGAYPADSGRCQHQSGGIGGGDKLTGLPLTHPSDPGDHDPVYHELPVTAGVPRRPT